MVALDLPPWWYIDVTWGPGDGSTASVAGVPTGATTATVRCEYRARTAAEALVMCQSQWGRSEMSNATMTAPQPGRA
jgi:hypothetical protein